MLTLLSFHSLLSQGQSGIIVLAQMCWRSLERVTKESIPNYLSKYIFDPLEMHDTGYNLNALQSQRVMKLHSRDENNKVIRHKHQVPTSGNTVFGGTHGLFSTADDYAKFCLMILHNGS